MADTGAVRAQRARRHAKDDHSLCVPGRCIDVTPGVTRDEPQVRTPPESKLGPAGRELWDDVTAGGKLPALQAVLLIEACRMADRLDKLDEQLRGEDESWLRIENPNDDGGDMVVTVDKALSESRQMATALKQLVAEIRQVVKISSKPPAAKPGAGEKKTQGGGRLVELVRARVSERGDPAAG